MIAYSIYFLRIPHLFSTFPGRLPDNIRTCDLVVIPSDPLPISHHPPDVIMRKPKSLVPSSWYFIALWFLSFLVFIAALQLRSISGRFCPSALIPGYFLLSKAAFNLHD